MVNNPLIGFNSCTKQMSIQHKTRQYKTQARTKRLMNSTNICLKNKIVKNIGQPLPQQELLLRDTIITLTVKLISDMLLKTSNRSLTITLI